MSETPVAGWQGRNGLWYPRHPACGCPLYEPAPPGWESKIHNEQQVTGGEAWRILLDLVDRAAADGREKFTPSEDIPPHLWPEIVTLPAIIATLTNVGELHLYGSHLIAIPPEIGEMSSLTTFTPYTSHRLHWYPYEITRCAKLQGSTVSTRALYGNYNTRLPFPALPTALPDGSVPSSCSVCKGPFSADGPIQRWISLMVATDVLPLLVHACSHACIGALPEPRRGYVDHPHEGGPHLEQPPAR